MRRIIIFGVALAVAGLGVGALQAAEEDQVPKRKPGLWEIVTVAPVSGMTKRKVCIGEDDNMVTPENAGDCSKPMITRLNEGSLSMWSASASRASSRSARPSPAISSRATTLP